jgi:hypothetical protein
MHHPPRMSVRRFVAVRVLTCAFVAANSHAAPADAVDRARALFAQAESDEDGGRWSEALDKLRAVAQVKLTPGVRYHIALCEEHVGQLVHALADYREAEDGARLEDAQDVLRLVGKQLAALDPRVPRLTVHVAPSGPDTKVTVDGEPIANGPIDEPRPVDPGVHYVQASAPNLTPSAAEVTLRESEWRVLDMNLRAPPSPAPAPSSPPPKPTSTSTQRLVAASRGSAIATTTLAVVLAGAGAAAFLLAGAELDNAVRTCPLSGDPAPDACDGLKNRVRAWDFAAAGSWAGALAAGTIALVLWAKPADDRATGVGAALTLGPMGLIARGRF